MLLALTAAMALVPGVARAQPADPLAHLSWPEALKGEQPLVALGLEGTGVPEVVDFHGGQGLRFSHDGETVARVIDPAARRVTGREIAVEYGDRRPGDPPVLFANADKIRQELGWEARYTEIEEIVGTAWKWFGRCPEGYG